MKKIQISCFAIAAVLVNSCGNTKMSKDANNSGSAANSIDVAYMNMAVSPKDDFFQFANGTWVKNNPVPSTESEWGSFNELDQSNKTKLDLILLETLKGDRPVGSDKQILGDFYSSFMNMDARNAAGITPIKAITDEIEAITNPSQILGTIANLHKRGIDVYFNLGAGQDLGDPTKTVVYIGQAGLGLPSKEYYFDEKKMDILEKYGKHVTTLFSMYTANNQLAQKMANQAVAVEKKIAKTMMTPVQMRDISQLYNVRSRKDVSKTNFKFDEYTRALGFPKFDSLVITQLEYINSLEEYIYNGNLDEVKSYLIWNVLNNYAGSLSEKFVKANFDFYSGVLSGTTQMKPMKEEVIEILTGLPIGEVLGKAFVEKHYSVEAKNKVNTMVDNLLVVFEGRIKNLSWMTDVTKKEALFKLKSIGRKLGYPDKWNDYSSIVINPSNYIQNIDNITAYALKKNYSELGKPVDKSQWGMPAHMVNAYYHPLLNEIAFPAGIMQAPFFDEKREDAVNYARIGMVIGHEFTHGFDDFGSKFAANGSFTNWWTEDDRTKFDERTKTLGETFSNFCPIEGHCVNPELTMGENIADLGGLTMAYYAYTLTKDFKSGKVINGYTPAQRFFISFAQLWKINYTDEELKNRIANDSHSPGMFRVNGPLRNCPEFFEAFDVKEGDKMRNSNAKVAKIW
jgi:putative endopeptidase